MPFSSSRGLVLAAIESVFDVAESIDAALDAFEVINPEFVPDITSQRRAVVSDTISPPEALPTRKLGRMRFQLEVKGNGNTDATVAPRIGRLLRACGFAETALTTAAQCVYRTVPAEANTGDLNFYGDSTTYAGGVYLKLRVEITTGGGSGVATAAITAAAEATRASGGLNAVDLTDSNDVTLTDGSEITVTDTLGNTVVTVTPDFQSNEPEVGDVYWVHVRPIGHLYTPISQGHPSVTVEMEYPDDTGQAILHRITGARGTFGVSSGVGEFPTFDFEFTGSYVGQSDASRRTPTFEDTDPVGAELQALALAQRLDAKYVDLCTSRWAITLGNTVPVRTCLNQDEATKGAFITAREPTFSMDPEAILASAEPIFSYLENGTSLEWWARHGQVDGNTVIFHAPNAQLTNVAYGDRDGLRTFNLDGSLARLTGDDELQILFT